MAEHRDCYWLTYSSIQRRRDATPIARAIWLRIKDCEQPSFFGVGNVHVSYEWVAIEVGCSLRAAKAAVKWLRAHRWLETKYHHRNPSDWRTLEPPPEIIGPTDLRNSSADSAPKGEMLSADFVSLGADPASLSADSASLGASLVGLSADSAPHESHDESHDDSHEDSHEERLSMGVSGSFSEEQTPRARARAILRKLLDMGAKTIMVNDKGGITIKNFPADIEAGAMREVIKENRDEIVAALKDVGGFCGEIPQSYRDHFGEDRG